MIAQQNFKNPELFCTNVLGEIFLHEHSVTEGKKTKTVGKIQFAIKANLKIISFWSSPENLIKYRNSIKKGNKKTLLKERMWLHTHFYVQQLFIVAQKTTVNLCREMITVAFIPTVQRPQA